MSSCKFRSGVQDLSWKSQTKVWIPVGLDGVFNPVRNVLYIVCQINFSAGVQTLVWLAQAKAWTPA